ncbi:MAG: carboxypeptidase-like regulatory domain-containing protein [Terriglobales bacterium]
MRTKRSGLHVAIAITILMGAGTLLVISSPRLQTGSSHLAGTGYVGYNSFSGQTFSVPPQQQREPETDMRGSVRGVLVDESDSPIGGLEVELIPVVKTGDERWYEGTLHSWTNAQGEYRFPRVDPGEYFVAVQKRGAPDGRHPFAGAYYPGVDDESSADRVLVIASSPTELHPIRLRRVETVTLKINVAFEDGSHPAWSNLLFHNSSFPHSGIIGNEAPGVENGQGQITLPKGFEYYARAKVDCNDGPRIETRESRPIQRIMIEDGSTPEELTFVIPGPPCQLWSPK